MRCECGQETKEKRGTVIIDEGGVKITLEDVRIFTCPNCGEETHSIPRMEALFQEIAATLAKKRERLMPQEIRFLRKYLGFSGQDFARKMGVDHTTVSKWERLDEPQAMGPQAERVLRLMALAEKPIEEYPLEEMATEAAKPSRFRMRAGPKGWTKLMNTLDARPSNER
jgi:putative zinc finger/helix-turn-helix YgiT family protein